MFLPLHTAFLIRNLQNQLGVDARCQTALFVAVWSSSLWCQCHICYQAANSNDAATHHLKETQLDQVQHGECFKDWLSQGFDWEWLDKLLYPQNNALFWFFFFLHKDPVELKRTAPKVIESIKLTFRQLLCKPSLWINQTDPSNKLKQPLSDSTFFF